MSGAVLTASASWNSAVADSNRNASACELRSPSTLIMVSSRFASASTTAVRAALSCRKACSSCCKFAPQLSANAITAAAATHGTIRRNRRRREPPAR